MRQAGQPPQSGLKDSLLGGSGPAAPSPLVIQGSERAAPGQLLQQLDQPYGVQCCDGCSGDGGDPATAISTLRVYQWLILLSLNAIGPFSSDAYLPNLPDIEKDLGTSRALASLTIQINWIVLGLINPVIGGLSDAYGRKTITAVSLLVFVVGAVGSALSKTLPQLMIARIVMGCGQAVSVIASAVIRDLVDDPQERMRITGFFNMLQPLMILAAPSLGGVIGQLVGWRDLFWGLAGWGALTMVLMAMYVPESNKAYLQRQSSSPAASISPVDARANELESKSLCAKLCEMFSSVPFTALTLTAAVFMGGIRSMLCAHPSPPFLFLFLCRALSLASLQPTLI